jgi:hypothetical protein
LTASSTFWPSWRTPSTTSSTIEVALRSAQERDRWFESGSLQRGVSCEPEFRPASRAETQAPYQTARGLCTTAGNRSVGGPETQPCERSAHVEAEDNAGSKAAQAVSRSASGSTVIAFIQRSKWQARGPGQPHCPLLRTLVISQIRAEFV